ncbi:hypothetical protein KAFR_0G01390 [Kazachstania africana CBS 2517]|uniref:2,5-diamino-6-ribosylamino-4(3H)-pyrimidinone 5'-phosphate reductase n=1 Tax=Kazachstania africana (strain ATCC 22294 / BCRC 22015 / CBS 2517 / CECT 1963 / NBRC 1671 / NRRL Y-8276) TaxID=1071382 RepID=H2AXS3_KAZAF|nr:hypothetical protein KAFR_0G01390 [Kazachstania africana CBS 2517]CCF59173.1 hypothetical protein KAFR_0G01390 [Kazachstania africana CBS 2517]
MSLAALRDDLVPFLAPYLPSNDVSAKERPFITLTYAQSLDSRISAAPGVRTAISHSETKTMTHYLRYHHDGILIGSRTALADDPGLNCKFNDEFEKSPRPIILDLSQKWRFQGSQMYTLYKQGRGKPPIVVVRGAPTLRENDVDYLIFSQNERYIDFEILFSRLEAEFGLHSVMVEGGAFVINELLARGDLVDSLVITIGSVFLGKNGVEVSPANSLELKDIDWWNGTRDAIMCARFLNPKIV